MLLVYPLQEYLKPIIKKLKSCKDMEIFPSVEFSPRNITQHTHI